MENLPPRPPKPDTWTANNRSAASDQSRPWANQYQHVGDSAFHPDRVHWSQLSSMQGSSVRIEDNLASSSWPPQSFDHAQGSNPRPPYPVSIDHSRPGSLSVESSRQESHRDQHMTTRPQPYRDLDDPRTQSSNAVRERRRSRSPDHERSAGREHDRAMRSQGQSRHYIRENPSSLSQSESGSSSSSARSFGQLHTSASSVKHNPASRSLPLDKVGESSNAPIKDTAKGAVTATTKKMALDISKWNKTQAQLHRPDSDVAAIPTIDSSSARTIPPASDRPNSDAVTSTTGTEGEQGLPQSVQSADMTADQLSSFDFKDAEQIACLLCQRKFKLIDTLHKHEKDSQLHRSNLADLNICRQGVDRKQASQAKDHVLEKPIASAVSTTKQDKQDTAERPTSSDPATPLYRDRAQERRAVFGADKPASARNKAGPAFVKSFQGPQQQSQSLDSSSAPFQPAESAPEKPIDANNIGNKLLAMMGWAQGQGLGAAGQGRTDIVPTKVYKPGAGLGSAAPQSTADTVRGGKADTTSSSTTYLDALKNRK